MTLALDVLLSFAFHARTDVGEVRRALGPDALLLIDSGAFTAHTTGKPISLTDYAEFLTTWRGSYSAAVTLDVIGDPVGTRENTKRLHGMGHRVMPVFTTGAPLPEFDAACRDVGYVAVGGVVGIKARGARDDYVKMLAARAREHGATVHLLGVGGTKPVQAAAPYSADTSTASRTMLHGMVSLWDGQRLIQFIASDRDALRKHRTLITSWGLDVRTLLEGRALTPEYRWTVAEAAMLSLVCQGETIRTRAPQVPRPDAAAHGLPGPRLCTAAVGGDSIRNTCAVAGRLATGDLPAAAAKFLRTTTPRKALA